MTAKTHFTTHHFSQANPLDAADRESIPALLRRVADTIEDYGDIEVNDIVLRNELTQDGDRWPSMTVYYDER